MEAVRARPKSRKARRLAKCQVVVMKNDHSPESNPCEAPRSARLEMWLERPRFYAIQLYDAVLELLFFSLVLVVHTAFELLVLPHFGLGAQIAGTALVLLFGIRRLILILRYQPPPNER